MRFRKFRLFSIAAPATLLTILMVAYPTPHEYCGKFAWDVLPLIIRDHALNTSGDMYQFGVFEGGTLGALRKVFPEHRMWGFDSFQGLPKELNDVQQINWREGNFRSRVDPNVIVSSLGGPSKAGMIVGFYNESLPTLDPVSRGMSKAIYADIDVDSYTGAYEALDWLFKHKILVPGSLVSYDDWWPNPCSPGGETLGGLDTGEGRAHREISIAHNVEFMCVGGPCQDLKGDVGIGCDARKYFEPRAPIFKVVSVGVKASHGFSVSASELNYFRQGQYCSYINTCGEYGFD